MNMSLMRRIIFVFGSSLFVYGAWYLPRPLMLLSVGAMVIFLCV